ncbi:hypothetical protein N7457_007377 [Penicillium paradoxum]|uniref:uncharacterized protein n=1 Tax=Penicillium paradoxum TaxID=176176 RepID=UPI00254795D3|nr:uncharacterized protein N7457_007377 [Penicillium paradoxum]KAJ5779657.1 hypothetical protein N7457_007377 [Penicillium paradoxum]
MRSIYHLTCLALTLALSLVNADLDDPQLMSNVSLHTDSNPSFFSDNPLKPRALECSIGYSECAYDTSKCCPLGDRCCGTGYCAEPGETCCTERGTCASGYKCCAGARGCAPIGGECCEGGYYCPAGKRCRLYKGRSVCCAPSGCIGENAGIGDGGGVTVPTISITESVTRTRIAVETVYKWYTSTIYWTYWSFYWTSFSPYTVKTVTSTIRSTYTVWSVYATNAAVATSSLADQSSSYNYKPPYTATYLSASSTPVTLAGGLAAPTGSPSSDDNTSGSDPGGLTSLGSVGAAASVRFSGTGVVAAVLVAAIGGLAFRL